MMINVYSQMTMPRSSPKLNYNQVNSLATQVTEKKNSDKRSK